MEQLQHLPEPLGTKPQPEEMTGYFSSTDSPLVQVFPKVSSHDFMAH